MATTTAPRDGTHAGPERGQAIGIFAIVVTLWLAFGAILIADPGRLPELWAAIQGLWLPVRAIVWLVFLPWVAGLWAW